MRMRRKKHLFERLDVCNEYLLEVEEWSFYDKKEEDRYNYLDLEKVFGNSNPVYLEIGCGRGDFAIGMAKKYPDRNFIAVEKISNVIVIACEKAYNEKLSNLKFLNCSAENLCYYLRDNSINGLYLNFSCPYPKNTYENRRLTYYRYLEKYKKFLISGSNVVQKTDNMKLFEYSIESFSNNGFLLHDVSIDLHNSKYMEDNIVTEYENKFASQGLPIYKLEAKFYK